MTTGRPATPPSPAPAAPPALPAAPPPLALVDQLVELSSRMHGHLCPGQVIGVRMAILGLGLLGFACPLGMPEIKQVVGIVEIERCLADAVAAASGLRFGRGSLKMINQGLLAASFMDLASGRAVRIVSREQARALAPVYAPKAATPQAAQVTAYRFMTDAELFDAQWVAIRLAPHDLPGARPPKIACAACGALVRGGQTHRVEGRELCAVCAGQGYFSLLLPSGEV
ncbi:MAG: FmdE family protein [Thermodesulfobacteriota bacterium]